MNHELAKIEPAGLEKPLSISNVLEQVKLIQQVMRDVMQKGTHYDVIPGCGPKPALLKPGAEKICLTFRLAPEYEIQQTEGDRGHREYRVVCTLRTPNGRSVGQGVGSCSTMESKYRFRTGPKEPTGYPVPGEYWQLRKTNPEAAIAVIGGPGHIVAKEDGVWQIFKQGEKVEHDNPADNYNTVLKMAKKRAHVDAVLTATAASDIFTQDVEDLEEKAVVVGEEEIPAAESKEKPAAGRGENGRPAAADAPKKRTQADKEAEFNRAMAEEKAQDDDALFPRNSGMKKPLKQWRDVICNVGKPGGEVLGKTLGYIEKTAPHRLQDLYNRFCDPRFPDYIKELDPRDKELHDALIEWDWEKEQKDEVPM